MARLEAIAKGLFYPTPPSTTGLIAKVVRIPFEDGGTLFDPCAGEGHAAAFLSRWWSLRSFAIELDAERAKEAATRLDVAHRGSYHQLSCDPERAFSVLFLNPPYDEDAAEDGVSMRQEVVFLRALSTCLVHNGLLIYVVPRRILKNEKFREVLTRNFRAARAFRFPEPEVQQFDQVVVLARRYCPEYHGGYYPHHYYRGDIEGIDGELLTLGDESYGDEDSSPIPASPEIKKFRLRGRPPEEMAPSFDLDNPTGAYASTRWAMLTSEADEATSAPLMAPRPGHQAMLLAAGRLNGCEIDGYVMKGGSFKVTTKVENEKESIDREQIVSHLSALSLTTGELDTWRVDLEPAKTAEWFQRNGEALARAILESHTPSFDGDLSRFDFSKLRAPGVLPGHSEPLLLDIQKEAAAAVVHRWRRHKTVILCGEQGTGKTTMAIVATSLALEAAKAANFRKVVVVCPSHLVPKWIRECGIITSTSRVARTAKRISEVDAFFEDPSARYLILSKEMAKLGARWRPAFTTRRFITKRERQVEREPGNRWAGYETEIVKTETTAIACPVCGSTQGGSLLITPRAVNQKVRRNCDECRGPLWVSAPINAQGTKRWALARHINRRYAGRYALVIDECHQHAGAESDQGRAVHMLATAATKILAMTGTLYGGRASSIFHLLYRIDHTFREQYGHDECAKFVQHHGLFETVYETEETTSIYNYRKGRTGGRVREIPGMSPAMIPMLLPYCIFVKLKDMQLELPPYSEEVEIVEHDPAVEKAARELADGVRQALMKHPHALGQYLMACLGYPDRPDQSEEIVVTNEEGVEERLAFAPAFPDQLWPKDVRVAEICREEVDAGRRCLVYFSQTHRRDARGRVRRALEEKGLRVVVLDSNVAPEKREDWLRDAEAKGFDVLLTNGKLVETGMDLLFANTIIQYGTEYSLATLRQSIRRSWRLGQTLPVRVIFMAYKNTMQNTAINLIAKKMRAAEMVDGDEAGGLAQHDVGGTNFLVELAHEAIATQSRLRSRRLPPRTPLTALAG